MVDRLLSWWNTSITGRLRLQFLFISALAFLTFPEFDPIVRTGLDSSYVFAFNYFFQNDISHGTDVIFAYGPLGFIRFPLLMGNNYPIAFFFTLIFQFLFIGLVFFTTESIKQKGLWLAVIAALLLSSNLRIDEKMIGCVALSLLLHSDSRKLHFLVMASIVTAVSFFVKLNIAAASVLMVASYLGLDLIRNRRPNNILIAVGLGFFSYFLLWLIINHNLSGSLLHLRNWFFISNGNLGATAINAPNSKVLLTLLAASLAVYWLLNRNRDVNTVYVIFLFALWAVFRYSIAREENYHVQAFFNFLILFSGILFLAQKKTKLIELALLVAMPYIYYENMLQTENFDIELEMKYGGIANFKGAINIFRDEGQAKYNEISAQNLSTVLLTDSARKVIADHTVDVFPWEVSYVASNGLNYTQRPLFQLGCVNTSVLDRVNADFLRSDKAPQYFVWTRQNWGGEEMSSIDHRYILSDDGQHIFELLNNYSQVYEDEKVRILKRTEQQKLTEEKLAHPSVVEWDNWIPVPELESGNAWRLKFTIEKTLVGKLKHALYKEPEYHMLYQLQDGTIKKHRFVVQNSESGVWVAPYLEDYNDSLKGVNVEAVKFIYTDHPFIYGSGFTADWHLIRPKDAGVNQH